MNKKPGYRPCPACNEYCPIIKKVCPNPNCKQIFPVKEKPIIIRKVEPEKLFTEREIRELNKKSKYPKEYQEYEIRGIIGTPAGESPVKFPQEINQQEISIWANKVRLNYLKHKLFISNDGLLYLAKKTYDWKSPEFRLIRLFMEKVEDHKNL